MNIAYLCSELYELTSIYFSKKTNMRKAESYKCYLASTQKQFQQEGIDEQLLLRDLEHNIRLFENITKLLNIGLGPRIQNRIMEDSARIQRSINTIKTCCDNILMDRKNNEN